MAFPISFIPPFDQLMPPQAFNNLIADAGPRVLYMKGHNCPCVGDTGSSGSFNQQCQTCFGRGVFWDMPTGPWVVLLTLITWIGRNVDIGANIDEDQGMVFEGHPIITIPSNLDPLWSEANTNDIFVEMDSIMRFQAVLRVGEAEVIPAWHILGAVTVAPSGAVVVEDPTTNQPVDDVSYTIVGGTVTLNPNATYPNGYPRGTSYTVEYTSPIVLVIQENFGGLAHTRPFGQGIKYPRRFKSSLLDLWLRDRLGSSNLLGKTPPP